MDEINNWYGTIDQYLASIERSIFLNRLRELNWNRSAVARSLGITFRAARYKLHKLGIEDNGAGQRITPKGFSKLWPKLRETALLVNGHKCNHCGALAKNGAILHVDHIKPLSKYPEMALDLSNLQVLCGPCNMSKGARDE